VKRPANDDWFTQNHRVKFEVLGEIEHAETTAVVPASECGPC
jgi:hypothetical protein